jgi:hypothetical protein
MGNVQMQQYQVVAEADTIGLTEAESMKYFEANGVQVSHAQYYILLKRIRARKTNAVRFVAKNLPEVHITQIESLKLIRKKLFTKFLGEKNNKVLCELARTISEIERQISEYNGWTQKITEETLKKFGTTEKEEPEEPIIHAL